jgi:hypothetical protein
MSGYPDTMSMDSDMEVGERLEMANYLDTTVSGLLKGLNVGFWRGICGRG